MRQVRSRPGAALRRDRDKRRLLRPVAAEGYSGIRWTAALTRAQNSHSGTLPTNSQLVSITVQNGGTVRVLPDLLSY
jgi:hypothetical protein